ncbi:uncharacterized protein LOC110487250 [Oncorhynchus mykiss]|uniref:Uncharacterized protein n=1 Tax=Oncorhynchus mykiss TaxID=8022 RepID=A0A8K9WYB3_ONCMY|nr:uncharacterized protein LOC110487250 [Oncorhynchus mykiss]
MVELMKFTRDICRLLGIGGDGPGEQEEMERGGGRGGRGGPGPAAGGDVLSGEEELSEEEKTRKRAERRRAKRKRQKERKKLEKEKSADAEQEGEASESESESEEEEVERVVPPAKNKPTPPLTVSGNKSNRQPPVRTPEEEPEWDVRSAFVANAASHIRPKARTSAGHASRENKENESRTSEVESSDPVKKKGASLTEKGIQLFKQGQYSQAVDMFSEAIHCDPKDHRFFGNRSYCYWCLELYPSALSDAQRSIQLAPDWPKGYFRKGSALMGLKRYGEAEGAMQQVLKLDQDCEEASIELFNCKVLQLMDLGFEEGQSVLLLEKFTTVQAALGSPEADRVVDLSSPEDSTGSPCPSLWVGNVTVDLTEKHIWDLFKTCGEIESIRVLHERFCAFVNFKNANMAARALERLQGVELESTRLVIRYPDRWMQRTPPSPQRTNSIGLNTSSASQYDSTGTRRMAPINGDECFFWRTTGCFYGDRCRFKHKPDQRGRDRKPWQP